MFPLKLQNFHTCQVIVSTFIQVPYMSLKTGIPRGADGDLLVLIGEALNATLKVMTPYKGDGWGMPDKDGNWIGSLGDIYNDLANFSMTSGAITLTRFKTFHMSKDYNSINMVWVTHPAIPLPSWQKLLRPFQMKARISLAVSFLLVVVVALFARFSDIWVKIRQKMAFARRRTCVVFYSWTICMGMPITSLPSKPAILTAFLLWLFYCFMIRTFYQASLIHAMKDNSNYPEFEDLEDILNSGY
uniref:Ionotropic receptor IR17 n=1 Tax=Lobesia botrana TaxID=209534 RepID=A0A345BF24_9NEOP|nr:ionotropic receptor IR17 [Lobesia botrana]